MRRCVGDLEYQSSVYLYSVHQLVTLPTVLQALPHLSPGSEGRHPKLDTPTLWRDYARRQEAWCREVVVAVSALEAMYLPRVMRSLRLSNHELDGYERWRSRHGVSTNCWKARVEVAFEVAAEDDIVGAENAWSDLLEQIRKLPGVGDVRGSEPPDPCS